MNKFANRFAQFLNKQDWFLKSFEII